LTFARGALPRLAAGACADAPFSARFTVVPAALFFTAPAPVLAAIPAVFDDAFFTAPLPVEADVRVDFAAAAAFV
jgi:hypothetical protein